jgi:hypothetical protein
MREAFTVPVVYTQVGANTASFALTDSQSVTVTRTFLIEVRDDAATDLKLRAIWNGMNSALIAGNKAEAMRYLNSAAQAKYGPVFDALIPGFASIAASYSSPATLTVGENLGEHAVTRNFGGTRRVFLIYYTRDTDGVWRLGSM